MSDSFFKLDEASGNFFSAFRYPHAQLSKQQYALVSQKWLRHFTDEISYSIKFEKNGLVLLDLEPGTPVQFYDNSKLQKELLVSKHKNEIPF